MYEMMLDLETLDTKSSAVVLSVGAVIFETYTKDDGELAYSIVDRFLRVLKFEDQMKMGRTVSEDTLLWWNEQSSEAKDEAFGRDRCSTGLMFQDLRAFLTDYSPAINKFWANPAAFDFPIIESLAESFSLGAMIPWDRRQRYDLRTTVYDARYSVDSHVPSREITGVPHAPVYDCEWQIDLLTAARVKMGRRVAKK